jgi:hypothetical protein
MRFQISALTFLALSCFQFLRWASHLPTAIYNAGTHDILETPFLPISRNETAPKARNQVRSSSHNHSKLKLKPMHISRIGNASLVCSHMIQIATRGSSKVCYSFPRLLNEVKPFVLNTTWHYILNQVYGRLRLSVQKRETIFKGLDRVMQMFDSDRLRRSLVNRMPAATQTKIMDIIEKRLVDPENNPPLYVMVFGGSIVEGVDADFFQQGNVSFGVVGRWNRGARFSSQLQAIMDAILSPGVVEITNMASGGLTSDVASPLLEYSIYPPGYPLKGPDLIISSFGYNDARMFYRSGNTMRAANEQFLKAAYATRCDGLPAVVFVDDIFCNILKAKNGTEERVRSNLLHSRVVNDIATWNDVMVVSYTKAFMHYVYADPSMMDDPVVARKYREVLFGHSRQASHPPLLYHSGVAWILAFQLLRTIGDHCQDEAASVVENKFHGNKLDTRLMPKYDDGSTLSRVTQEWWNQKNLSNTRCSDPDLQQGNTCSLSWLVHRSASIKHGDELLQLLSSMGASNTEGWMAIDDPRAGWVATQPLATFSIFVPAKKFPIRKVTFLYMKSYGSKWKDSLVDITLSVLEHKTNDVISETYGELVGFHKSRTSVSYKKTFDVDVNVGDTLKATFVLVGGTTFKFTGMLFCVR